MTNTQQPTRLITAMVAQFQPVVMILFLRCLAVGAVAYFRLFKFSFSNEMTAIYVLADHFQVPIKVNDSRYLLKTTTINYRLVPDETISRIVKVMLLNNPETNLLLAPVTLYIDEESILVGTTGTASTIATEKLL